jgi:hypothetical protein
LFQKNIQISNAANLSSKLKKISASFVGRKFFFRGSKNMEV